MEQALGHVLFLSGFLFLFSVRIAIRARAHALQNVTDHRAKRGRLSGQGGFVVVR
jgi:hypothetical protein